MLSKFRIISCSQLSLRRLFSNYPPNVVHKASKNYPVLPAPELDSMYFCDQRNVNEICENIVRRGGLKETADKFSSLIKEINSTELDDVGRELTTEMLKLPNTTCPKVWDLKEPKVLEVVGEKKKYNFEPREFHLIKCCRVLLTTKNLGKFTGPRTYYLQGALAQLEEALVNFTVDRLIENGFELISVPDILHPSIFHGCGMETEGKITQVYMLDGRYHGPVCLTGTSEFALATLFMNDILPFELLPKKVAAVSRCYRAEDSGVAEEKGIFRVHQFTKVEMFAVTADETHKESESVLEEFVGLQKKLFSELGLHFQVMDMPPSDLGPPAHRKIDVEAWMAGRKIYGEISSASNCTDYQSRRLGIKYRKKDEEASVHCHTVNGTACAVPRMMLAIAEGNQQSNATVTLPKVLVPYMDGMQQINQQKMPQTISLVLKKS